MNADLYAFLTTSLNFNVNLCNCLSFDGYDDTADFVDWTFDDISKYCSDKSSRTPVRGGINWPDRKKKDLQGFAYYVTQRRLEGVHVDVATMVDDAHVLTLETVREFYEAAKIAEDKGDEMEKKKPEVLKSSEWVEWEKSIVHYLNGMRNRKGVPLSYVIRGDRPQGVSLISDECKIYAADLQGPQFSNDSKEVYNLIKELVQSTDGDSWLPVRCSCGRAAMQALRAHYDGPDQAKARIDVARAKLESLFYKNEYMLSFESYSTQMKKHYDVLEKYHQPEYEANKIDAFLKGIRNDNIKVINAVSIARTRPDLNTFQLVQEFISNQFKTIFPPMEIQPPVKKNGRRVSAARRKKVTKRKTARVSKVTIIGRKENGVQLQGHAHYYFPKEFRALNPDTRAAILQARKDNNYVYSKRNDRSASAVGTHQNTADDTSSISASLAGRTITMDRSLLQGVIAASATNQNQQTNVPPSNGSHPRSNASIASSRMQVTFDASGNISHMGES